MLYDLDGIRLVYDGCYKGGGATLTVGRVESSSLPLPKNSEGFSQGVLESACETCSYCLRF